MKHHQHLFRTDSLFSITIMKTIKFALFAIMATLLCNTAWAQINTLPHYNLRPELLDEAGTPDILVIFDNSGSMNWRINETFTCADHNFSNWADVNCAAHPLSRSFLARTGMAQVFDDLTDKVNLGLMVYNAGARFGSLRAGVQPLNPAHRDDIKTRLAIESINNVNNSPTLIQSDGGTPIEGTLMSAYDYLVDRSLPTARNQTGTSPIPYATTQQCPARTSVILVSDGSANSKPGASTCTGSNTFCSAQAAGALWAAGVDVYVVGFGDPSLSASLDAIANQGSLDRFGNPRNAFIANNTASLVTAFNEILGNIFKRSSTGSGASISTSSNQDSAAFVQSLYLPTIESVPNASNVTNSVYWAGISRMLFVDEYGYIREDSNNDKTLGNYNTDKAIRFEIANDGTSILRRLDIAFVNGFPTEIGGGTSVPITDLNSLWELSEELEKLDQSTISQQRNYTSNQQKRFIFTSINGNQRDFTWHGSTNSGTNPIQSADVGHLYIEHSDPAKDTLARDLINWTRGDESGLPNKRNRTIDLDDANGVTQTRRFLLGDTVHASPITVGAPNQGYFELYGDKSYFNFANASAMKDRRTMSYIGANDGMVHAVNAGRYDPINRRFIQDQYPLGYEMWAYIPESILPHLRFWADDDYSTSQHVYGVDGHLVSFDLKVKSSGSDAWRTYLVATTGYGGYEHQVDTTDDGVNDNNIPDKTLRPSIVILDVTNPDQEPRLVAEIQSDEIGATTSKPVLVKSGNTSGAGEWYLAFGSGPSDIKGHYRDDNEPAKVFLYQLTENAATLVSGFPKSVSGTNGGFVGDIAVADWDTNYIDDALYFGVSTGDSSNMGGRLMRMTLDNYAMQTLVVDNNQSFDNKPLLENDNGEYWIFTGTGRINTRDDFASSERNAMYAVRESFTNTGTIDTSVIYNKSNLLNVTGVEVFDGNGRVSGGSLPPAVDTYADLQDEIKNNHLGWYRNKGNSAPTERVPGPATSPGLDILSYTTYKPASSSQCGVSGTSDLYFLSFSTGTAPYNGVSNASLPDGNSIAAFSRLADTLVTQIQYTGVDTPDPNEPGPSGAGMPGAGGGGGGGNPICEQGDVNCDCFAEGYVGTKDCSCSRPTPIVGLCVGADSTNPNCEAELYGYCGLGRKSWKEIDFRY